MRLGKQRNESKYMAVQYFYTKRGWSISWMCKRLKISRAAYYKWLHREVPAQELENIEIAELIKEYDDRFNHILGYRRMTLVINTLNHKYHSKKRIHRIMQKLKIKSVLRKKKRKYPKSDPDKVAENVLKRNFFADAPNQKWVTDVTEIKIPNSDEKLYLSLILDLYDRYPVSYVVQKRNNNHLVIKTFEKAVAQYPDAKPILHSDRGFQYTSKIFHAKLEEQHMTQSMSRVGCCIDNGPMEGLWSIIKTEMFALYEIEDEGSLRAAIDKYMYFYSHERFQERYKGKTPYQVRSEAFESDIPTPYPIPVNPRIEKYKAKWSVKNIVTTKTAQDGSQQQKEACQ